MSLKKLLVISCLVIGSCIFFAPTAVQMIEAWLLRPMPAKPLTIPPADSANKIQISQGFDKRVITDQQVIKRFKTFISQINNNWRTVPDTFPTPQYTVALINNYSQLLILWLGNQCHWIGAQEGEQRVRSLSVTEANELKAILGI